ncbi:hypothetical protein LZ30DRAFT_384155 [Colletotrichum cereale]|nr:hypothetical protein LZ30DRAFT_384155 [Colletotrichum cereale]
MRLILGHIENAYSNKTFRPPPNMAFADFVDHQLSLSRSTAAHHFWASYLYGASAGSLFNYDSITDPQQDCSTTRRFQLPRRSNNSTMTVATLVTAAWAKLIGRLANSPSDVVLGYVLTGRTTQQEGAQEIVGPLINRIPLRIRLGAQSMTGQEEDGEREAYSGYLKATQEALLGIPASFEIMGMDHISSISPEAHTVCNRLPMDLLVHPSSISGDDGLDLPGADAGLVPVAACAVASPPGRFAVEIELRANDEISVTALWDGRAASQDEVEQVLGEYGEII